MKELVTTEQAERALVLLAAALPILGLLVGLIAGAARRRLAMGLRHGFVSGLLGPALWVMWRVYNLIMNRYGLDSVRGLLINLALFVGVGLAVGWMAIVLRRRSERAAPH